MGLIKMMAMMYDSSPEYILIHDTLAMNLEESYITLLFKMN